MKLQHKMMMMVTTLVVILVIVLVSVMYRTWFESVQKQVALDAMDQAVIIAENRDVQNNLTLPNGYLAINQAVESLYLKTGIQYLYVINNEGIYFAHPLPQRVNTALESGEIKRDIQITESAYYYELSVDATVEGYAPVYSDGVITGIVVVGIYNGRILQTMMGQIIWLTLFAGVAVGIGVLSAYLLSRNIKRDTLGLEPSEIALLLKQKDIIIDQIGEGLLATDQKGQFILVNENAKRLLDMPIKKGDSISSLPFQPFLSEAFLWDKDSYQFEWRLPQNRILVVVINKLHGVHDKLGYLIKIEDMSLVRKRAEELTEMKQLTHALRAQNHEFMNKLHAISGLIQLNAHDDALNYIEAITAPRQAMLATIQEKIKVAAIGGLLLTKHSKLTENKVNFTIDDESFIQALPEKARVEDLTSILGNLIDNAEEATQYIEDKQIKVGIFQDESSLVLEVSDNGPGMTDEQRNRCFEKGFSTKGEERGYGLGIVRSITADLDGEINLLNDHGLVAVVTIPMKRSKR